MRLMTVGTDSTPNFPKLSLSLASTPEEIREVQRQLPRLYSNMSLVNTIAVPGYEGCHYSIAGYQTLTARLLPVVQRDFYGVTPSGPVTGPNLIRAYFTSAARTAIALEFDQPMSWSSFSLPNYFINDVASLVTSGSASGNVVTLQLSSAAALNSRIDYVKDTWSFNESVSTLLFGSNAQKPVAQHADTKHVVRANGGHANACKLFRNDCCLNRGEPLTAVFFRPVHRQETIVAQCFAPCVGKGCSFFSVESANSLPASRQVLV